MDKRTYCEYYCSLLKIKQIFIFTFCTANDYNSRSIKICLFLFSFVLTYTANTVFFDESIIHKIFIDKGKYNYINQIPHMLYSSLISFNINTILKCLFLPEQNVIEIKNNNNNNTKVMINKYKKFLKKKYILFFIFIFSFLLLFWYYISCFCVVYQNTQIHVIINTLISFGLCFLYPFGLSLLPGIFRIPSLRTSLTDKECLYKFSQMFQTIF